MEISTATPFFATGAVRRRTLWAAKAVAVVGTLTAVVMIVASFALATRAAEAAPYGERGTAVVATVGLTLLLTFVQYVVCILVSGCVLLLVRIHDAVCDPVEKA